MNRLALTSVAVIVMVVGPLSACGSSAQENPTGGDNPGGNSLTISKAQMGAEWPFTVESGTLRCDPVAGLGQSVTFEANGKTYALNGTAKTKTGLPPVDPIWAKNPDIPGAKMNIGPVISKGTALCG